MGVKMSIKDSHEIQTFHELIIVMLSELIENNSGVMLKLLEHWYKDKYKKRVEEHIQYIHDRANGSDCK